MSVWSKVMLGLAGWLVAPDVLAVEVSGSVGGSHTRTDAWLDGEPAPGAYSWDWMANLDVFASPFRAGLLDLGARGSYQSNRGYFESDGSVVDTLGFDLRANLLADTILPMALSASRGWNDFAAGTELERTGTTRVDAYAGNVLLLTSKFPKLRASVTTVEQLNRDLLSAETSRRSTRFSAGLSQAFGQHTYEVGYDGALSGGTVAASNYGSHQVDVQLTSAPAPGLYVRLSDHYALRAPTVGDATNPRFDDNNLSAGLMWRLAERSVAHFDYAYHRSVTTAGGLADAHRETHAAAANVSLEALPELLLTGGLVGTYGSSALGSSAFGSSSGDELGVGTQSAQLRAGWRRAFGGFGLQLSAGGSAGLLESSDADVTGTFGVGGSGGVDLRGRVAASLFYSASYAQNGIGAVGAAVDHLATASLDAPVTERMAARARVSYQETRREDPSVGTSRNRGLNGTLGLYVGWLTVSATLGLSDGLSKLLGAPTGVTLPERFNTVTRHASVEVSQTLLGGELVLTELARTLKTELPSSPAPDTSEDALGFRADFRLGLFMLSLDERFSIGRLGDAERSSNLVMARLTRSFGASL
ncbi:MAG: hypothetical protein HY791_13400 [Deltaproteobacteria bacterium]|nr:hypothetical protein [Deltaproteobacteria bacterium]